MYLEIKWKNAHFPYLMNTVYCNGSQATEKNSKCVS